MRKSKYIVILTDIAMFKGLTVGGSFFTDIVSVPFKIINQGNSLSSIFDCRYFNNEGS